MREISQFIRVFASNVHDFLFVQLPSNTYATKDSQVYQQQGNILPESSQRYYNEYQQPSSLPSKGAVPNIYESQQLAYQQEVNVGNQLQAIQQKTVTAKFAKNVNKGNYTII